MAVSTFLCELFNIREKVQQTIVLLMDQVTLDLVELTAEYMHQANTSSLAR